MARKSPDSIDSEAVVADFTIIVDTREQAPYQFTGFRTNASARGGKRDLVIPVQCRGLPTGDYSILGFESLVAVERKSLEDLYGTLGGGRERFSRELERLAAMNRALVVVEATWPDAISRVCGGCGGGGLETATGQQCQTCQGTGRIHPVDHSRLAPKSVFRSIVSWSLRYPTIHWQFCGNRHLAERWVFQFLAKWYEHRAELVPELAAMAGEPAPF